MNWSTEVFKPKSKQSLRRNVEIYRKSKPKLAHVSSHDQTSLAKKWSFVNIIMVIVVVARRFTVIKIIKIKFGQYQIKMPKIWTRLSRS